MKPCKKYISRLPLHADVAHKSFYTSRRCLTQNAHEIVVKSEVAVRSKRGWEFFDTHTHILKRWSFTGPLRHLSTHTRHTHTHVHKRLAINSVQKKKCSSKVLAHHNRATQKKLPIMHVSNAICIKDSYAATPHACVFVEGYHKEFAPDAATLPSPNVFVVLFFSSVSFKGASVILFTSPISSNPPTALLDMSPW